MRIDWNGRRTGLSRDGWAGIRDESSAWTATILASWMPPTIDWWNMSARAITAILAGAAAITLWRERGGYGFALPAIVAAWLAWSTFRQVRSRQPPIQMSLVLSPDALRLSTSARNELSVQLRRDHAAWLISEEVGTNWHVRQLTLIDTSDRAVAQFVGSLASVRVQQGGLPEPDTVPDRVPVAVLLGAWWPHPAKRISRQGTLSVPFRWREPDIAGYPGHELRRRVAWSLLCFAFAALLVLVAIDESSPTWLRLTFGLAAVALIVQRVRILGHRL